MKLNIAERIMLLGVLPRQSDYVSLRIMEELRMNAGFSQAELDKYKIESFKDGSLKWEKNFDKEVRITKRAAEIITASLKELSEKKQLTAEHLSIFEKFHIKIEMPKEEEYKE